MRVDNIISFRRLVFELRLESEGIEYSFATINNLKLGSM